jgi:hypothetical protein
MLRLKSPAKSGISTLSRFCQLDFVARHGRFELATVGLFSMQTFLSLAGRGLFGVTIEKALWNRLENFLENLLPAPCKTWRCVVTLFCGRTAGQTK